MVYSFWAHGGLGFFLKGRRTYLSNEGLSKKALHGREPRSVTEGLEGAKELHTFALFSFGWGVLALLSFEGGGSCQSALAFSPGRPGQAVQDSSSSCRTTCLSGHAQLRHWEPGPSGSPGWAPGLRRRPNEVSMLSGSPGPAEAAAARAQKRKFDSRCSDAHCRIEESEVPVWPHVWSRGPVVFCPLARANIETLPTGGGEHKTRRRRRPQRGGEHNHDPTTTTCNIPVPGQRCRRQGG